MAATKISDLTPTTVLSNTDLLVVARGSANVYTTNNISVQLFANSLVYQAPYASNSQPGVILTGNNLTTNATGFASVSVQGPYANDAVAAAANLSIGTMYYDSTGLVRVRIV